MLLDDVLAETAGTWPDATALVDGARRMSFAELDAAAGRLAGALARRFPAGSRIACIGDNCAGWVEAYYGVPRAGMVLVHLNQRLDDAELDRQVDEAGAAAVLGQPAHLDRLSTALPRLAFDDVPHGTLEHAAPARSPDDPAWVLFTSGTTSRPKPVVLTHANLVAGVRTAAEGRPVAADDVFLQPFPLCHIAGHNVVVHHLAGRPVVLLARFRADEAVAAVRRHGVTSASMAPTMLRGLLDHLAATAVGVPTLRRVGYGAAPMAPGLLREVVDRLGVDLSQGYGMTECAGNVAYLGPEDHRRALGDAPHLVSAAGRPSPRVELRVDGAGEILVKGAQVAAASAGPDGWLHTGDVGRLDDEGYLYVVDRKKDVIVTGGENVSSREVEDVLSAHPGVAQVAVVGVPDDYWGEAVCAVVVPRAGVPVADLQAHARARLAGFKCPKHVVLTDQLPVNAGGKVVKAEVRRLASDAVRGSGSGSR